jgi:hypothetical protein
LEVVDVVDVEESLTGLPGGGLGVVVGGRSTGLVLGMTNSVVLSSTRAVTVS